MIATVDVLIPLIAGTVILAKPEIFLKKGLDPSVMEKKKILFKKIGWTLVGVAALYFVLQQLGPR